MSDNGLIIDKKACFRLSGSLKITERDLTYLTD